MKILMHQQNLITQADLIQVYAKLHNAFSLVTQDHSFNSQQTNVISGVDSVMYHWLYRI